MLLTDPEEAAEFVRLTKVDALAIAIRTSHGAYKFNRKPDGDILSIERLKQIHARLPNTHLVMYGSSSAPQELQEIINAHGGDGKPTWGVPIEEIREGIRHGVRKVNVDTDLRMAFTGAIRQVFARAPAEFDPRKYLAPAIKAMAEVCCARFEQFGASGHASHIKPVPLADMAKRYKCQGGVLSPCSFEL